MGLPCEFTSSALVCIQTQACQIAGKKSCAYWGITTPSFALDPNFPEGHCLPQNQQEPAGTSESHPCRSCSSPGVTKCDLSAALFGTGKSENRSAQDKYDRDALLSKPKRVLRRFMHGGSPMRPDDFFRVLANAWVRGWLSDIQLISLTQQSMRLTAASSVLRKWAKNLRKGMTFGDSQARLIPSEMATEEKIQWQVFVENNTQRIARDHHWPDALKQDLLDTLCA